MSVKKPWDSSWKTKCRTRIKGCDGVLIIVTKNTKKADGQLWEVKCAKEEFISCRGIWGDSVKASLSGVSVVNWTWDNISNWLDSLY